MRSAASTRLMPSSSGWNNRGNRPTRSHKPPTPAIQTSLDLRQPTARAGSDGVDGAGLWVDEVLQHGHQDAVQTGPLAQADSTEAHIVNTSARC